MSMFANPYFKPYWGEFRILGAYSTVDFPLSEADANADHARGYTLPGKIVDLDHTNMKVVYTTGDGYGFMNRKVSKNGALTDAVFLQSIRQTQDRDAPLRRGAMAEVLVYEPDSLLEFEGLGVASVETNVITSGTGALSNATAANSELTCEKGGWRLAASGEMVLAVMERANLTPEVAGNLRILVKIVGKYKKV